MPTNINVCATADIYENLNHFTSHRVTNKPVPEEKEPFKKPIKNKIIANFEPIVSITYNDSFKAKLIHIIDSNFSQIEKHHDTSQSTID